MAMTIVEPVSARAVTGGVDTHLDVHVAAALDDIGGLLSVESFDASPGGNYRFLGWLRSFGDVARVGVEGTGSYGASLARSLRFEGVTVVEVDRPNRQARRRTGKSDPADALEAARAALSGRAQGAGKTRHGHVEAIRVLALDDELAAIDALLAPLVAATAPSLLGLHGVGVDTAATLLVAAGDNPGRLRSEAAWAHLCGVAPIPASSGKVTRWRLNRGGDRQANGALWVVVITRMSSDPRTRAYVERRVQEGRSKPEIIRILKRYVAREVFSIPALAPDHSQQQAWPDNRLTPPRVVLRTIRRPPARSHPRVSGWDPLAP